MATIITPNTRGHYPAGYPRSNGAGATSASTLVGQDGQRLEQATDSPDLNIFKAAIEEAQSDASNYFYRNGCARDWWYARWPGQTVDGRKYGETAWPWPGASDTRVRTVEKVIGQHRTLGTFAYRNMKLQAKSNRPFANISQESGNMGMGTGPGDFISAPFGSGSGAPANMPSSTQGKESQQVTTLLNWMWFTHMGAETHREMRLGLSWRNGYGAAIMHMGWLQMRQLNKITVSVPGLEQFVNEPAVRQFMAGDSKIPIGENLTITDLQEMIMDPAYADDLAVLLRTMSHEYLGLREARKLLENLRELRYVEIPIPYVFVSRPQLTALRPMVDVLFPAHTDDLQRAPWSARIEMVSETELRDRVETESYAQTFVDDALDRRGSSNDSWSRITTAERSNIGGQGYNGSLLEDSVELVHFYSLVQDRGVPIRFHTVFHMDVDEPATHAPDGYEHGESCFHPMRFEIAERPILTSRGIAEIAYTWEQELKRQWDAQSDRSDMALRPVIFTDYANVAKMKALYMPGTVYPTSKFGIVEKDKPLPLDQASVMIVQAVEGRVREHFGIFGADLDPDLKKLRQEEFVDDLLAEFKPVSQQMLKLCRQLLPDQEVAQVIGTLSRPFHLDRETLQAEFEISATVDLRNIDQEWVDGKLNRFAQIVQLDTQGQLDRTAMLKAACESADYSLAESALPDDTQVVTQKEVQAEQQSLDLILASGRDQPLPQGANYQLRYQTLQQYLQEMQQNPVQMQKVQQTPDVMKVFENRAAFFQRQLQQQQNAQIGRLQVSNTFSKQAPNVVANG